MLSTKIRQMYNSKWFRKQSNSLEFHLGQSWLKFYVCSWFVRNLGYFSEADSKETRTNHEQTPSKTPIWLLENSKDWPKKIRILRILVFYFWKWKLCNSYSCFTNVVYNISLVWSSNDLTTITSEFKGNRRSLSSNFVWITIFRW